MTAPIFYAAKQQRGTIGQQSCTSVKHTVDGIRPVIGRQNRVRRMSCEQDLVAGRRQASETIAQGRRAQLITMPAGSGSTQLVSANRACFCSERSRSLSSSKAMRKA